MANPDRPSFFGRDDNPFGTLFREDLAVTKGR